MKLQKNSIDLSGMILKIAIVAMIAAIFSVSALALEVSSQSGSPSENYIILKNAQFSTDAVPPSSLSSSSLSSIEPLPTKPEDYYIVQFKGLILEEWKKDVRGTGAVIFSYVPNNAFIVRMNTSVKAELENLDSVQWIGFYDPSYRVSSTLSSGSKQNGKEDVLVMLFDAGCNEYVSNDVIFIGGKILDNGESILKVRINQSSITDIAAINGVSWVDRYVQPVVLNDVAAGILNVSTVQNTHGLTGSGQIIAVADTGLDTGFNDASMHDDLEGRIDTLDAWWEEYNDTGAEDNHGHGTHVAGSVLGNGNLSAGLYSGMAPEARLVFQALQYDGTNPKLTSGRLHIPTNLYSLFQQAYDAGAKVHSNSWGSNNSNQYGNYTDSSQYVDSFMWDNPDLLIVFAAGNEGGITNKLTPPGTAKNALTVGASENYRPDKGTSSDNIDDIASFSSRGPTDDNRIKPDVVAPGTVISSTASSLVYSTDYTYMSGTSMATPLTAGTAALVRQYYVDNESISPTAALLKATLINGAADMGKSSIAQGWGRVDLESSLFPSSPRAMQYHDNISLGLTDSWSVSYHLNNSSVPFKATLVWTDQPATAFVGKTLVNNLDLNITGPDGNYLGNGGDDTNNVEHVELLSPSTGWYTVTVNGTNVPQGPQPFAIVLSGSFSSDEIAPASVTELTASDIGITWIKWTWNNPNDTDFNHTMLYLDNVFKTNVSNDTSFYNLTGLLDNTTYEFNTKTVDISGNINLSWTNDTATTLVTLDTIAPIVTIDVPEENHNYTSSTLWLNATANEDIAKWWYNINNTGDTTFSGNRSLTLPEGIHDITVIAQDIAGNNGSSMVNFSIDTIAPTVTIDVPEENHNYTSNTLWLNATANEDIAKWWYNINNTGDTTFSGNRSLTLSEGIHNITVIAQDIAGNNGSSMVNFSIDTIAPIVTIDVPEENHNYTSSTLWLNATANEDIAKWWYNINNTGDTTFSGNRSLTLPEGIHDITVIAQDIAGNNGSSMVNFSIDTIAPTVTIDVPEENHNYTSNTLWLNATANEDIAKWWYNINNTGDTSFSGNRSLTLSEGIHNITVIAQDIAGNNGSSMVNFSIDTIAPASVTGLSVSGKGSTWINWTWTNPSDGDFNYTMIYLDGVFKTNMTGASYNATGLIDNTEYNISTHTVDTVGIINSTWINDSASTLNTLPPASVTDLTTSGREITWINWTWNNPIDQDFNHTMLYLNNVFQTNVSNDTSFYNATGLAANTKYDFSTKTVDISGNINASWTNASATTKNPPTANFTSNVTLGKQPLSVQFIDSSTAAESWVWVFGDGNDANAQHPVHTYAEPGKYHVSLTANNSDGIDTVTKNNYIVVVALVPPFADFASNVTAGTEPLSVRFEDNSSNALTWEWDFGDVNTSNEIEPVHTYTTPGSYNVSLKVSNDDGSDYILKENFITVIALSKPIASFTAAPITGSYPLTVYFTEQSINETSWFWNFGDGNTSTEPDPSHTYVTAGTYNVSLNVSNAKYDNFTYISDYITVSTPTTDTTSSSSSGSSGGGGGSSVTSERYENILVKAVATRYIVNDIEKTFTFTEVIDITYINVTADLTVGDVKAIVESLNTTSNLVSKSPEGRVYKNINIWLGDHGFEKRIIDSSIGFRVEKTWLKENSVPEFSVRMSVYKGSNWNILPTYKIGEDDTYIYYEATPSEIYSSFAIVEPVQKETTATYATGSSLTESSVTSDTSRPSPSLEVSEEGEGTASVVKTESKDSSVKFLLFAIPLLIIISVSYVAVTRGHHIEAKIKVSAFLEEMKPEKINDIGNSSDESTISSSSSKRPVSEAPIPKVEITKSDVSAKIKELEESGILSNVNKKYLK